MIYSERIAEILGSLMSDQTGNVVVYTKRKPSVVGAPNGKKEAIKNENKPVS